MGAFGAHYFYESKSKRDTKMAPTPREMVQLCIHLLVKGLVEPERSRFPDKHIALMEDLLNDLATTKDPSPCLKRCFAHLEQESAGASRPTSPIYQIYKIL